MVILYRYFIFEHTQTITGTMVNLNLMNPTAVTGFGTSLASGVDVDGNTYNGEYRDMPSSLNECIKDDCCICLVGLFGFPSYVLVNAPYIASALWNYWPSGSSRSSYSSRWSRVLHDASRTSARPIISIEYERTFCAYNKMRVGRQWGTSCTWASVFSWCHGWPMFWLICFIS